MPGKTLQSGVLVETWGLRGGIEEVCVLGTEERNLEAKMSRGDCPGLRQFPVPATLALKERSEDSLVFSVNHPMLKLPEWLHLLQSASRWSF